MKVLIVDDHMLIRTTVAQILRNLGFRDVEIATQGEDAWALLNRHHDAGKPFNIIFADWQMPVLDGFSLLTRIRADKRHENLAFVMLTAEQDENKIIRTLEEGVTSYLVKPVSPETMEKNLRYVTRWLEKKQAPAKTLPTALCNELKPVMEHGMERIFSEIFNVRIASADETTGRMQNYGLACIGHLYQDDVSLTLRFLFDEALLRPLLAQFYAPEFLNQRETYEDAACEIVNILCNQVKAYLGKKGYHLVLNLPRMASTKAADEPPSMLNVHFSLNNREPFMVDMTDGPPG